MKTIRVAVLAGMLAAAAVGCGSSGHPGAVADTTHAPQAHQSSAPLSSSYLSTEIEPSTAAPSATKLAAPGDAPAPPGPDNVVARGGPMDCSTVVDSGPPSVTAQQVIDGLAAVDGSLTMPTQADLTALDNAALDLENYSGTVLSNDAAAFATDASSYSGMSGSGTVDTSRADIVLADIAALQKDCPS